MIKRVFIDTNPLIYLLGQKEPFCSKVLKFMSDCIADGSEFYTSTITDVEYLVKPLENNDLDQIEKYRDYLKKLEFVKCFISEQIAERAAKIRAKYTDIKLADALQIAASLDCNCDVFLTNDKQLKQITEVDVVYLGDL
ncbi:MAG: PIN domain-containing protein [Treponema sp.]|nr:PIN domain-containing protein [Treponema sp.]